MVCRSPTASASFLSRGHHGRSHPGGRPAQGARLEVQEVTEVCVLRAGVPPKPLLLGGAARLRAIWRVGRPTRCIGFTTHWLWISEPQVFPSEVRAGLLCPIFRFSLPIGSTAAPLRVTRTSVSLHGRPPLPVMAWRRKHSKSNVPDRTTKTGGPSLFSCYVSTLAVPPKYSLLRTERLGHYGI